LVRLTVLTRVECVVTSWVRVLAVVITVASFVTVEVKAFVVVVNFLVEELNSLVVCFSGQMFSSGDWEKYSHQ